MIESLIRQSLANRLGVFVFAAGLAAAGWYSYQNLTVEAFPDPTDTQVQIITLYPGQPAEEVERRVSIPLERAMNDTPNMIRQRSVSLFGLSMVTMNFADGTDPMLARQNVNERIGDADLPNGVQAGMAPLATPIGEVYRYTLDSSGTDPMMRRTLNDWTIRPALLRVEGVADVVSYGGLVEEIHVEPDPTKMASLGVVLPDLLQALNKASANATGGTTERGQQMLVIRSLGTFGSLEDVGRVRVGFHDGVPVLVKDVAKVEVGYAPRQGVVTRDDDEDAVQGIVIMRRGENPSAVLSGIRQRVNELNERFDRDKLGVHIHPFYDRTDLVDSTLETVFHNLAEGAFLVTAVLFVFLLSLRASLVVAAVIPLSLAASFVYLNTRHMSANLLSMGAIDFGIIVDGAVILVEHIFHHAAGHPEDSNPEVGNNRRAKQIYEVAREVARPTLFSLLIIVAAYLPIFALQRVEGRIFSPMANTVVSALVGAMLVSFTVVPVLCFFALKGHKKIKDSPVLVAARKAYEPTLLAAMRNPLHVLVLAGGFVTAGVLLAPRLGSEFLPELNEGSLYVTISLPPTISLSDGRKMTPRIKQLLRRNVPEVTELLSQLGRPEDGTDAKLQNNLEIFIKLKPMNEWGPNIHKLDDLVEEMAHNLQEIPGIEYDFSQPIRDNVNENISGQQGQIAIKIYGDDLVVLRKMAERAEAVIADTPGAADAGLVKTQDTPAISVAPNRLQLAHYDLDLADLQDFVETALGGHVSNDFWDGQKKFDVTVRFPPSSRTDAATVKRLMVPLKDGSLIPLSALADVRLDAGRAAVTRENGRRYVGIRTNVRNRDLGSFVADAQGRVDKALPPCGLTGDQTSGKCIPQGYDLTWGGEFENQQRAMKRLELVLPLALLLTFLLLFASFGTVWDSLLIMINLPVALVGGLAGLAIAGMTLSVSAAVGFIALLGQAVLNGVLVVSAIRARRDAGQDLWTASIEGARERLRAVLMTALLASLGLLPAALSHAIGSETQRPIAVVVVSGTISSAALTLLVLPVTYYWATKLRERIFPPEPDEPSPPPVAVAH
jgi:cobalt-zinc-cadmium resistance protein CzcA